MTTLQEDLAHAYEVPADPAELERFRLTSDDQAAWALRKMRQAIDAQERVEEQAHVERDRIEAWVARESAEPRRVADYFHFLLAEYAEEQRAAGRKSIRLTTGTVGTRAGQLAYGVDRERFLEWARSHRPDLINVTEAPALAAIKAAFSPAEEPAGETPVEAVDPKTGEAIPGLAITRKPSTVTVAPA